MKYAITTRYNIGISATEFADNEQDADAAYSLAESQLEPGETVVKERIFIQ